MKMATRPDRYAYERGLDDFLRTVRAAQRTLAMQVRAAITEGDLRTANRRRLQFSAVQATLDQLGAAIDREAARLVREAFDQGSERARSDMIGADITAPEIPGTFAGVAHEAVVAMQDSITGKLQASRETVGRTVADVYARAGRRASLRAILGAEGSPRAARRALSTELLRDRDIARAVKQGGFGFVDKAGKRWALDTYTEMAVRTTTREAVVQGALARMASHGIDLARVTSHGSSCQICVPWEGRLVSLDGGRRDYEGEAATDLGALPNGGPPFHPQCRHSLSPVSSRIDTLRRELATASTGTI